MSFFVRLILIQLFQVCLCFRSFKNEFNKEIFQKSCPTSHQYWPDIYPHLCAGTPRECKGTTQLRQIIVNNIEVMCHPQIQGYILQKAPDTPILLGWIPYTMIYSYDSNGNLIFTTESISDLRNNGCQIGQKYAGIYKCIYCRGANYGQNCATSPTVPTSQICGQFCKTCDSTNTQCASCIDGQSPLDINDVNCTLACQPNHKTCELINLVYSVIECMVGYEILNGDCVQCPTNCLVCSQGMCSQCKWPYTVKNSQCFGDPNCMKYDYVYDSNGMPIDTDCQQCDVGYFKKGTRCSSCQNEPGLEKCFICHNANECKSCFATNYLTADKKCVQNNVGCNSPCQTCLVTDPNYCTTCYYQNKLTARIIPGQCVCDQIGGYAELNGQCVLCTNGDCLTCTLTFGDCTSCDPLRNRTQIGNTCPCLQGYYDTGLADRICQQCYPSCYNCSGPFDTDCTDCGDPNVYHKQLVNGKCICTSRTIEINQSNGSTLCLPCHPRCEKCQAPVDNTLNQYCTMCIAGQIRVVSNDLKCICKDGYGEDGIQDICFKCHYTCLRCNGILSNNCTECSTQNNRYLTSSNECLCNTAYYDTGNNDVFCYSACHHSCINCLVAGEDSCISCPSTRQPDRIGVTFKCLCKDSHYYSDTAQLECQQCHFTCKTCHGSGNTDCLTCDLTYRQLIISACECPYGYYDVGQLQCQQCYYTCNTCFGSQFDNCTSCSNGSNRIFKANQCVCQDGHIENPIQDQVCMKCSYRCSSCTGSVDNCDACPDFSFRDLGVNKSCLCPPKYLDQPENPICIACHNTCLTCSGSQSNQCTSCSSLTGRLLNNQGECKCALKYYDSGLAECQACSRLCYECVTSSTNCTSCPPEKYLNGNTCSCKTKLQGLTISTYQNQQLCSLCHYSCLICKGSSFSECDSCWDQDKRIQLGTTCICQPGYYDVGIPKCSKCNFRCQTCAVLDTQCLSCHPLSFRVLLQSQCQCPSGYYDDGINSICQKCHYSCLTCSQIATKCVTCSTTVNRQFNNILNSCICNDYYFDNGVEVCQKCHYSCLNCSSQDSNQCKTCTDQNISFRVFNGGSCQCLNGYYDDGSSAYCKKCSIQCATCQSQSTFCASCPITRHLNENQCNCDFGFYETGQEKCYQCDQNCLNCITNSTTCIDCDQSQLRILNNLTHKCQCQNGTTEINGVCQYCDISCQTCLNAVTNCTSCILIKQLQNNTCTCIDGTYETGIDKQCQLCIQTCKTCINQDNYCLTCSSDNFRILKAGNQCVCNDGYFENSSNQCIQCDQSCFTCQGNSKYCLSCDPAYHLQLSNQNKCICNSSYYFNTSTKLCEACNITCKECSSVPQCIECEPMTRYYDLDTFSCRCKDGFYETYQRMCSLCDMTCKTCVDQSTKCLTCESIYLRAFNNSNKCPCLDGYFDVGIEMCQKCNDLCKTCQTISTQCLSCYETEQIRILDSNTCICKPGYFDNGQLICEQCQKSCLTCQGKSDYCTSCDIYMNRIDQSAIHKCPCLTNFFQDENEVCQKCHIKCSGCIQKADMCTGCNISNTSNRLTISQNCDCKDGYYDDGIQFQCQKCNYQCKTCIQSPSNCLICYSNLRDGAPACNCKAGFFLNEQQICESCDNKCSTCESLPLNCTSCKGDRINKSCDCKDGYFEAGSANCIQCDSQCLTCEGNQSNCLLCRGDRINVPVCNCQDGFYDDYQSMNCLQCGQYCQTCNLEGCLTCNGNRVLSEEKTCDCPLDSISHTDTTWCSSILIYLVLIACEVAVLDVRFSDDLLSIKMLFDFSLNPNSFQSQFQENICFKFFADETIKKLGNNPNCNLDQQNENQIILNLGPNATILPQDSIIFINYSIGHNNCLPKISTFILNYVKLPINLLSPLIKYNIPQYILNPCDDNIILVESKIQHGLRNFISISWSYLLIGQNGNANLEEFVLQLTNLQQLDLNIPIQTLPKQSQVTFVVEFQNFIKEKGQQQIQIQTHSGQLPTVLWQGKKQYYTFEIISLYFTIQKKFCSDSTQISNDRSLYDVSLVEIYRNCSNSRSSRVNVSKIVSDNFFEVNIEKYTLSPNTAYTFKMVTQETLTSFSSSQNQTIEIIQGGLLCQFIDTKKIYNYRKESIINIQCKDLDFQYEWNEDPQIKIEVSCVDLTKNSLCTTSNNTIFQVNKTDSIQIIPKLSAKPYSIWGWNVIATKQGRQYQFKYNIVFLDNDFKILDVQYSKGYTIRPINSYETLQFDFNIAFEDRFYLLQYQIVIIYNFEIIKILEPQYFQYQFRLFDYYQQFNKGNQFNLKFLAQFTNDIMPSQQDLQLTVNQPPICYIKLGSSTIQALQTSKIVANCDLQDDSPFTYQLRFFMNIQDYKDFQMQLSDYSLILNSFQQSNAFEMYLPKCEGVVLISIMDSRGSITNIESYQNVTEFQFNCSDVVLSNLTYKQKIILLLELTMNHYGQSDCIQLNDQLLKSALNNFDSEDLFEQLLVLQTIKLYKRIIIGFTNSNSSKRILSESDQKSCYDNKTKQILINDSKVQKSSSNGTMTFSKEFAQLKKFANQIILTKTNLENQIQQDEIFTNELLFQSKESISNSLEAIILFIDNLFRKISQTSFESDVDQTEIFVLTEKLINLIDDVDQQISAKVQVNGQPFTLNGQQLKYQIAKVTKDVFNQQLGLEKDLMDSLVGFVKKEELQIHFNHLNISKKHIQDIKMFLNQSQLEIDQEFQVKTKLQNYLYKKQYVNYEHLNTSYVVDMTEYLYCNQTSLPAYNFQCVQYIDNGSLSLCTLLIQENNNNQSVQVSCQCSYMGMIFLTRQLNQSEKTKEIQQIPTYLQGQDSNSNLNNQPYLLFHSIYIVFSIFMYIELQEFEIPKMIDTIQNENLSKKNIIQIYNFQSLKRIFKMSIKFIHEILCLFYCKDTIITKSYKFLKLSIFLSILIPLSFFETVFMAKETVASILIVNYIILLLLRIVFKIFEAIYRFKGKLKTFIVILYFIIHILSYFVLLYQYQNKNNCDFEFNYNMLILIGGSIILSYALFDQIFIFLRIVIYSLITPMMKIQDKELDQFKQLIYFFIQHNKLDQIFLDKHTIYDF